MKFSLLSFTLKTLAVSSLVFLNIPISSARLQTHDIYCAIPSCTSAPQLKERTDPSKPGEQIQLSEEDCKLEQECAGVLKEIRLLDIVETDCAMDVFNELKGKIESVGQKYLDLEKRTGVRVSQEGDKTPQAQQSMNREFIEHFKKCENTKLFPAVTTNCLTESCAELLQEVTNLKMDKEDCKLTVKDINPFRAPFDFERSVVQTHIKSYQDKCKTANLIPVAQANGRDLFQKDVDVLRIAYLEELEKFGYNKEKRYGQTILPWLEVVKRINTLELNKKDCNERKSRYPLSVSLGYYRDYFYKNQLIAQKEIEEEKELEEKFEEFAKQCRIMKLK